MVGQALSGSFKDIMYACYHSLRFWNGPSNDRCIYYQARTFGLEYCTLLFTSSLIETCCVLCVYRINRTIPFRPFLFTMCSCSTLSNSKPPLSGSKLVTSPPLLLSPLVLSILYRRGIYWRSLRSTQSSSP